MDMNDGSAEVGPQRAESCLLKHQVLGMPACLYVPEFVFFSFPFLFFKREVLGSIRQAEVAMARWECCEA